MKDLKQTTTEEIIQFIQSEKGQQLLEQYRRTIRKVWPNQPEEAVEEVLALGLDYILHVTASNSSFWKGFIEWYAETKDEQADRQRLGESFATKVLPALFPHIKTVPVFIGQSREKRKGLVVKYQEEIETVGQDHIKEVKRLAQYGPGRSPIPLEEKKALFDAVSYFEEKLAPYRPFHEDNQKAVAEMLKGEGFEHFQAWKTAHRLHRKDTAQDAAIKVVIAQSGLSPKTVNRWFTDYLKSRA
jgi:hypothetical protein